MPELRTQGIQYKSEIKRISREMIRENLRITAMRKDY